jgi:DNA mismatch repair protein MutS2
VAEAAADEIAPLRQHPDPRVRMYAVMARTVLGPRGPAEAKELIDLFDDPDEDIDVRCAAVPCFVLFGEQAREGAEAVLALERERTQAASLLARAQPELARAETKARETLARAKAEAASLLAEIRRAVGEEWDRLKASERSRRSLEASRKRLAALSATLPAPAPPTNGAAPEVGDTVEVVHLGLKGILIDRTGATATVQAGSMTVRVPVQALYAIPKKGGPGGPADRVISAPEKSEIPAELFLLGNTTEQAQGVVEKYLDDAFLAGLPQVRLVHGKGTGALRKAVHEILAVHPLVQSFRPGEPYEGGAGATVVELRVS